MILYRTKKKKKLFSGASITSSLIQSAEGILYSAVIKQRGQQERGMMGSWQGKESGSQLLQLRSFSLRSPAAPWTVWPGALEPTRPGGGRFKRLRTMLAWHLIDFLLINGSSNHPRRFLLPPAYAEGRMLTPVAKPVWRSWVAVLRKQTQRFGGFNLIFFLLFLLAFPKSVPLNERKFCKIQLQKQTTGKGKGKELTKAKNCKLWGFYIDWKVLTIAWPAAVHAGVQNQPGITGQGLDTPKLFCCRKQGFWNFGSIVTVYGVFPFLSTKANTQRGKLF